MDASVPGELLGLDHLVAAHLDPGAHPFEVFDEERRVRLHRGLEPLLHAEVHLELSSAEPDPTSVGELFRFRYLLEPEDTLVEVDGGLLLVGRHRELHVVQPEQPPGLFVAHGSPLCGGPGTTEGRPRPASRARLSYEQPLVLPQLPQT